MSQNIEYTDTAYLVMEQPELLAQQQMENEIKNMDISISEHRPSTFVAFQCTAELTGRIFPAPTGGRPFVLDFVDSQNRRVLDTGLHVYITGIYGAAARDRVLTLGSGGDTPPTGLFVLNPAGTIEITPQELPDKVLKMIAFACSRGVYRPVVQ
ncbi:hypothetical protein FIBSPDRAFT_1037922 [Athelia psychrophila]|uniref:Uncharacterized protein n=1 Tax=Athelia psychrophila TaxID=1759441 RepID=A0A166TX87_9AGAM|nr:hypothetical protein FIBSPDRAFT_1037922 [Fibularhizoctonia sp. CBS 109695]